MSETDRPRHGSTDPLHPFQRFFRQEAAGGVLLVAAAVAALVWSNSGWATGYEAFRSLPISVDLAGRGLSKPLVLWVNDGLMAVFFFVVGLEIKRELLAGELDSLRSAALPLAAALGGAVVPAAAYLAFNPTGPGAAGWGVPMATDIAFVLGVLALMGERVPAGLKVFVTALAIVDDLLAVLVVAIFYTGRLDLLALGVAGGLLALLLLFNRKGVRAPTPYALVGVGVWLAVLSSGVHATVAGVVVAAFIPARPRLDARTFLDRARSLLTSFERGAGEPASAGTSAQRDAVHALELACADQDSPLARLEHALHPWVAYLIVPLFALVNAGVSLSGTLGAGLETGVLTGIAVGLFLGKPVGVFGASWLAVRLGPAELPPGVDWRILAGAACLTGIGFTMSLFIAGLAFADPALVETAKLGIVGGSLLSAGTGVAILSSVRVRSRGGVGSPLLLLALAVFATGCGQESEVPTIRVAPQAGLEEGLPREEPPTAAELGTPPGRLQSILDTLRGPARVVLEPGHHVLRPVDYTDPTCGNCEDPAVEVPATRGLRVSGSEIEIVGTSADSVVLHTRSGYGVLFEGCRRCGLRGVTITDGIRDPDGRATDAGVVVRDSRVTVERCRIRDNVGDSSTVAETVVGIAGVAGREGAELTLMDCRITGNSWDGVALYRGAVATVVDNVIDGVDAASGGEVGGGRGVGIGLTWDAAARLEGNLVRRYWKGIGVFLDARALVRENIVEDVLTWGLAYWDAGRGRPVARFVRNAVYRTGACGAMLARSTAADSSETGAGRRSSGGSGEVGPGSRLGQGPGSFEENAIVSAGQNEAYDDGTPYCTQRPLAREAVPEGFLVEGNLFHDNRQPGAAPRVQDLSRDEFTARAGPLLERLGRRPPLKTSRFLGAFTGSGSGTAPGGPADGRSP